MVKNNPVKEFKAVGIYSTFRKYILLNVISGTFHRSTKYNRHHLVGDKINYYDRSTSRSTKIDVPERFTLEENPLLINSKDEEELVLDENILTIVNKRYKNGTLFTVTIDALKKQFLSYNRNYLVV
jgi:hypothetical protein